MPMSLQRIRAAVSFRLESCRRLPRLHRHRHHYRTPPLRLTAAPPPLPDRRHRTCPGAPPGSAAEGRGYRGGLNRGQMFEDPAVMRTVEGRPNVKTLDSAIVDCGDTMCQEICEDDDHAIVCVIDGHRGGGQHLTADLLDLPYAVRRGEPTSPYCRRQFGERGPSQMHSPLLPGSPIFSRQPLTPRQLYNQTGRFMFPFSRPCPSTPQSLTPKMMQLRFGANSPRPSPFYSPSSNPVQHFRYPGPVTQLHPQHKRLLSQKQRGFQRKMDGWDPYCNLMTIKEREWITRLQMIQLQSENPYLEDYYYQEYYRRIEAKMAEEELGIRSKREPPKLTTPYITKTECYAPVVHIEGSLGQVAVSTCYSPRRAISAVNAVQAQGPLEEQKDLRQQRLEVLCKIEKLFVALLEVEETERVKTPVLSEAEERMLVEKTQLKVQHIYSQLQNHYPADSGGEFLPFLHVSKGKKLLSRLIPFLKHDPALKILRIVTSNLPTLMSKDTEEALPVLYPPLRNVIGALTFSQLIRVLKDLTSSEALSTYECLTLACQNKFGLSLLYALLSQGEKLLSSGVPLEPSIGDFETWTDTIFQVAGQLSQCSLVEPLILPSNLLTLFCRYLDKRTVHQLKSNMDANQLWTLNSWQIPLAANQTLSQNTVGLVPYSCTLLARDSVFLKMLMYFNCPIIQLVFVSAPKPGGGGGSGEEESEILVSSGSTMLGQLLLQSAVILWLVQATRTTGYGAASNGQGQHPHGNMPQNGGGLGRMLIPSKGVGQAMGAQHGYGGYPTKGADYGRAAGVPTANGAKSNGYGAAAGATNGGGVKGYGAAAGATNGGGVKGYGAAGGTNGQGGKPQAVCLCFVFLMQEETQQTYQVDMELNPLAMELKPVDTVDKELKVTEFLLLLHQMETVDNRMVMVLQVFWEGTELNPMVGNGAAAAAHHGQATKGKGQGAAAGPSSGNGARPNGHGGAGSKPMNGYGRHPYGAGAGVGTGPSRGAGVPQLAQNQGKAYGGNGYGAQPMGAYNGGYGQAGMALGSRYGNGGMKGPKHGYGFQNGGATRPANPGYGGFPNGYGNKGYGANRGGAVRTQPGYGNGNGAVPNGYGNKPNGYGPGAGAGAGVPNGYGTKPNGHGVRNGAALGGYGSRPNGHGGQRGGAKPQTTKGVGAVSPGEGAKTPGTGYGVPAGLPKGQLANTGYGVMPDARGTKGAGKGLKGGALPPTQPSAAPQEGAAPQLAITQGAAPVAPAAPAPEPTSGILVMVTQEKYQKQPSPGPQGKGYKLPQLIATPAPAPAPEATPEPAPVVPQGKGLKETTSGPEPGISHGDPQGKCCDLCTT
ncbi:unnamed protein product [Pleuronectes platessa]|uniref:mRNA decay factor PAT1 domain-containing protein n=1 Tax=Pleuronectes platessa TaxID=8262 RepID=A0A9N7YW95_PLEPL|nr:unnamed protein product [Pleuronectes platessa]